jgi:hypothetical protein
MKLWLIDSEVDLEPQPELIARRKGATHAEQLETLMTLNFQQFEDVSLMAA